MIVPKLSSLVLVLLLPLVAHAQTTVIEKAPFENAATFSSNTNSVCWPVATGIHYWSMRWEEPLGTVTGGTVKLAGSMSSACSSPTDIIAAQTATSGGGVNGSFGAYKYVRLTFASYAGTGSVRVFVSGNKSSTAIGSAVTVTSGDINIANIPHVIVDSGGGGGIEYTEGDTDATIVGKAILMEVAANTLQPVQGTVADGLLVNLGTNNDVTVTGDALTALQLVDNIVQAEDAIAGNAFAGVAFLAVRQDSQSDLAADGDFIPPTIDGDGGLRVTVINGAAGGTAIADDGAFTVASTNVTPMGGCYQGTPDSVTDGDAGCLRMTIDRKLIVTTGITESADNAAFDHTSTEPPVGMGGIYLSTLVAHTTGDKATFVTDAYGRQLVREGGPCADHTRITSVPIDTAASANVQLVALNGSDLIYICGYKVVLTAAESLQFIYGTGTACATGETDIEGPVAYAANGGAAISNGGFPQFIVPAGNAFCLEKSSTGQASGHVTYVRTAAP